MSERSISNVLALPAGVPAAPSERERRTADLQVVTDRMALAAEAGRLGTWEWDVARNRVIWSPELEQMHGLEPGTFAGTFEAYQSDIHPEDRARVLGTIRETIEERKPHLLEYRIVVPDGTVKWVEARGRMFVDDDGKPSRLVGICMDVTERKRGEQALQAQHLLAELLGSVGFALTKADSLQVALQACAQAMVKYADAAFAGIWTLNDQTQELELQASAATSTEGGGSQDVAAAVQLDVARIARARQPYLTNDAPADPRVGAREWIARDGMRAFAGYPLMVGEQPVGVLAIVSAHALSEDHLQALAAIGHALAVGINRKQQEAALVARAAEMTHLAAALERSNRELDAFAYAASHDLRAPLRGIANLAQWIEEDLQQHAGLNDETREMLQLMRTRMHRMEALIEGLLAYSRAGRGAQPVETVDTGRLVCEVIDLLAPPEGASIAVAPDMPTVVTERLPLQQVLQNLIGNALKHGGGRVEVSARRVGEFYEISVRDDGPGVPPEFHDRIWGIFQTLEPRDKVEGTGIGLALVKKLVEAHGGRAWIESAPGEGATFRFLWRKNADDRRWSMRTGTSEAQ